MKPKIWLTCCGPARPCPSRPTRAIKTIVRRPQLPNTTHLTPADVLACSRSGSASTRLGCFFLRDFDVGFGDGLLQCRRQLRGASLLRRLSRLRVYLGNLLPGSQVLTCRQPSRCAQRDASILSRSLFQFWRFPAPRLMVDSVPPPGRIQEAAVGKPFGDKAKPIREPAQLLQRRSCYAERERWADAWRCSEACLAVRETRPNWQFRCHRGLQPSAQRLGRSR